MALETRLRAEEAYYDMSKITDKLYAQSKNGNNFYKLYELIISEDNILLAYRNIKRNTGSNTKGTDVRFGAGEKLETISKVYLLL